MSSLNRNPYKYWFCTFSEERKKLAIIRNVSFREWPSCKFWVELCQDCIISLSSSFAFHEVKTSLVWVSFSQYVWNLIFSLANSEPWCITGTDSWPWCQPLLSWACCAGVSRGAIVAVQYAWLWSCANNTCYSGKGSYFSVCLLCDTISRFSSI